MATLTTTNTRYKTSSNVVFGAATGNLGLNARYTEQDMINNRTYVISELYLTTSGGYIGSYANNSSKLNGVNQSLANGDYTTRILQTVEGWINHNSDGKGSITLSGSVFFGGWNYGIDVGSITVDIPTIPRASFLGNIPAFAIEDIITLPITKNVSSYIDNLTILYGTTTIATKQGVNNDDKFSFTTAQLNTLYSLTKNVQSVNDTATFNLTFKLETFNGSTSIGTNSKTVQGLIVDANPVLTTCTYKDIRDVTKALTGNDKVAIQGQSIIQVSGNYTIKKGATFTNYQITLDTTVSGNIDTIVPLFSGNKTLIVQVKDSRGNLSKAISLPILIHKYGPPVISNIEVYRPNPTLSSIKLKATGTYSNILTNNLIPVQYRYKNIETGTWSNYFNINLSQTNGNINIDTALTSLVNTASYQFEIIIGDKLVTLNAFTLQLYKSVSEFEIIKNDVLINGLRIIDIVYPVGRGFIDFTDTDYTNYLGGKWERELIGMTAVGKDASQTEFNAVGKTGGSKTHTLTLEQLPAHTHIENVISNFGYPNIWVGNDANDPLSEGGSMAGGYVSGGGTWTNVTGRPNRTNASGGNQSHNNLAPFKVVNYWKRTS